MVVRITRSHEALTGGSRTGARGGAVCVLAAVFGAHPSSAKPTAAIPPNLRRFLRFIAVVMILHGLAAWGLGLAACGLRLAACELYFKPKPQAASPKTHQSSRRTMLGSTRDARHAGSQHATAATNVIVATTATIVAASVGSTPNSIDAITRFSANAPARPATMPTPVRTRPCFITWPSTLP